MTRIDPHHLVCREIVELVTDYLEAALPGDSLVAFEQHLLTCPGCVAHLEHQRRVRSATRKLAEGEVDPALLDTLLSALAAEPRTK